MARMKTLHIAMTDPVNVFHENEELDHVRQAAWHDAIAGLYVPENYTGDARRAYDVGRQQVEETCHEEGIDLFNDVLEKTITHQTLTPEVDEAEETNDIMSEEDWTNCFKALEE